MMLGMLKRHEIKVLLKAGHSRAEVAKLAGVSVRSVKRVAKEGDVEHVDDVAEPRISGNPPSISWRRNPISGLSRCFVACRMVQEPKRRPDSPGKLPVSRRRVEL